jgi:hypothetical protein
MSVTVRFQPTANSAQLAIIPNVSENSDGMMSAADKRKLNSLPSGPLPPSGVSSVTGTAPITATAGATPNIGITPATDSNAGSMSAADKTKLDSLPSGPLSLGALDYAMFYGLTAGTGNGGPTDYPTPIAVRTANGTGAMLFPRLGPAKPSSAITALSPSQFNLGLAGFYEVTFLCHTTEPGQLEVVLDNALLPETCFADMNPTAGGHPIGGTVLLSIGTPNAVLEVVNPNGNSTALTITTADGSDTHANAQVLAITYLGPLGA